MERRFFIILKNGLPSIWKEDHQNFGERKVTSALFYKVTSTMHIRDTTPRKRKELLAIEESMETSIQKGIFGEMQSPWTGRYMGKKKRFYYFLIRGTNSKEIRY